MAPVADQLRPKLPKLAALMDYAEPDVLAYMSFPAQHRVKLHSTNPLDNGEIKRLELESLVRPGFCPLSRGPQPEPKCPC